MRTILATRTRVLLAALALSVAGAGGADAATLEELIEGAKKEGRLVWYTSMNIDDSQPLLDAFTKKYPFIKAELWRGSSEKVLNKIQTEARAGQYLFDVIEANAFEASFVKAAGLAARYVPPSAKVYRPGFVDPEGTWVSIYSNFFVLGYNTKLVPKDQAPRDWTDLLDPKWRGKFAMDPEDHAWLLALQEAWGRERANDFARKLAGQQIQWRKGHTLIAQLLAAGEFPLGLVYAHRMEEFKKKGAPVEWVTTTNPIPAEVHPVQVSARAPHPNAARLFVEFVASREGQTMIRDFRRIPSHPEVELGWSLDPKTLKLHPVGMVPPERGAQVIREFREIFSPTGS
ncbi:MAG TPA: extracellular solute-binding protein [Thermodesulfobacteriota bacterium]|nr:extracellular solute-binding protein [Thermodesulfobacteriota bacterium]